VSQEPTRGAVSAAIGSYFIEFGRLRSCSRNFWVVQLVNLLDGVAYFAMLTVSTIYLSETLGYDDERAAYLWAACMAVYTGFGFVAGFIGDSLGIKRTLHLSVILLVISRVTISLTESKAIVVPSLFVVAIGTAIMTPILISATKRYTNPENQTAGFNMLYFLMNIGAFVGNYTLDPLRNLQWGNRSVFMVGSAMSILCWLAILLLWQRGIDAVDAAAKRKEQADSNESQSEKWEAPWTIAVSVFRESTFWRFMLFLVILVGVRLVFEHQYQIYPKYYQRTLAAYLYSVDPGPEVDLGAGRCPDRLRTAFSKYAEPLGDRLAITPAQDGTGWYLTEPDRCFFVARSEGVLQVHTCGSKASPSGAPADLSPPLFEIASGTLAQLDYGSVSSALEQASIEHGKPIPPGAGIETNEEGRRWQIRSEATTYYVRRDEDQISVYASEAAIGLLNSINPLIICIGVIISTPIVARFRLFNVMFVGICVSAVSMLFLVINPVWFCGPMGLSIQQGYLLTALAQIILFSIGEVIWSPRLYEYTAAIAPEGREASYMSLSYVPMFFARFAEGPLAGHMLTRYCQPDVGGRLQTVPFTDSPQMMCLLLAGIAIATPVLIMLLRGVIQKESRLVNT
jgi:MFS family permease